MEGLKEERKVERLNVANVEWEQGERLKEQKQVTISGQKKGKEDRPRDRVNKRQRKEMLGSRGKKGGQELFFPKGETERGSQSKNTMQKMVKGRDGKWGERAEADLFEGIFPSIFHQQIFKKYDEIYC